MPQSVDGLLADETLVVAKRADTGSVWPLVNIPTQKYYDANRDFSLWEMTTLQPQ